MYIEQLEIFFFRGKAYSYNNKDGFALYEGIGDTPVTDEGLLPSKEVERRVKYIQGKVLTIVDAVILDKEQKKAIKDIINQVISVELSRLSDSATGFQTLNEGDMVQYSGSTDKFYEDNIG